jgi:hypothetical protein
LTCGKVNASSEQREHGTNMGTDQAIQQTILEELRSLRGSFESHKEDTSRRLTTLETLVTGSRPVPVTASPTREKE